MGHAARLRKLFALGSASIFLIAAGPSAQQVTQASPVTCSDSATGVTTEICAQFRGTLASEKAAEAATFANYISGASALLSFVSILLVLIALRQTRRANRISHESMRRQSRAHMVIHEFYWRGNPGDGFQFGPIWSNAGQSTTVMLRTFTSHIIINSPLEAGFNFPEDRKVAAGNAGPSSRPFMGPAAPLDGAISLAQIQAAAQGSSHIYIYGWAKYYDVFDREVEHVTKFCVKPRPEVDETGQLKFVFDVHDEHNCADEGCRCWGAGGTD